MILFIPLLGISLRLIICGDEVQIIRLLNLQLSKACWCWLAKNSSLLRYSVLYCCWWNIFGFLAEEICRKYFGICKFVFVIFAFSTANQLIKYTWERLSDHSNDQLDILAFSIISIDFLERFIFHCIYSDSCSLLSWPATATMAEETQTQERHLEKMQVITVHFWQTDDLQYVVYVVYSDTLIATVVLICTKFWIFALGLMLYHSFCTKLICIFFSTNCVKKKSIEYLSKMKILNEY